MVATGLSALGIFLLNKCRVVDLNYAVKSGSCEFPNVTESILIKVTDKYLKEEILKHNLVGLC